MKEFLTRKLDTKIILKNQMPRNQQGADATAPARAGGQREEAGTAGIGALDPGPGAAAQASGKSVSRAGRGGSVAAGGVPTGRRESSSFGGRVDSAALVKTQRHSREGKSQGSPWVPPTQRLHEPQDLRDHPSPQQVCPPRLHVQ